MPPMEVMTLAERCVSLGVDRASSVENAIEHVDGPGAACEQEYDPGFEMDMD